MRFKIGRIVLNILFRLGKANSHAIVWVIAWIEEGRGK